MSQYTGGRYITMNDGYNHLGFSTQDQQRLSEVERARYENWVREANNNVETDLFEDSDVIPLDSTSQVFAYAKSAALNWLVYKKRDLAGSKNASASRKDYLDDIERAKNMLKKTPTLKQYPIAMDHSDVLSTYIIPFSENQGWPQDFIY